MANNQTSITEDFGRYFAVDLATTPDQLRDVFQVRYRVYCQELNYEAAERFPEHLEHDEFDSQSLHCLITHKRSGLAAGCVRLVTTSANKYHNPLPIERYCNSSLDRESIEFLDSNRDTVCEISRLAVDGRFRRRSGAARTQLGDLRDLDCCDREQRAFSMIAIAGFMASTALSELTGRRNTFAMMETFLPRLMKRSGIYFDRAGRNMDYHGLRAPYFITADSVRQNMRPELRKFYYDIYQRFDAVYSGMRRVG